MNKRGGGASAAWGKLRARERQRKLSAQIAFLESIISFYVLHLSNVIVCQSNAVAARHQVECKFCLGNSSLCNERKNEKGEKKTVATLQDLHLQLQS